MLKSRFVLVAAAVVGLSAAPALTRDSFQGSFTRTLQISGTPNLEVYTRSGDVTIRTGSTGSISITGKIHVGDHWMSKRENDVAEIEKNPPIRQDGSRVKIDYVSYRNISIDYEITVPADTVVRSETGSGNQTADGLKAGFQGHTGSGDVRLGNIAGEIRVETGSGNIEGRSLAGPLALHAGSGDIRIEETGSGDVNGGARAETGSGNVELTGKPAGSWYVQTSSGNAEVNLPQDAAFDLEVSTGSGTINVDHPLTTTIQGRLESPNKHVSGKVRGGGPMITVHTGSGDVQIR
jgi:DUF4097 and DUF4098 domain-containing protein YvlB